MKRLVLTATILLCFTLSHSQTLQDVWEEGLNSFNEKDYHDAVAKMDQIIRVVPDYAPAYFNKGVSLLNLGDLDGACEEIGKAIDLGFKKNTRFYEFTCGKDILYKLLKKQFYPDDELIPSCDYRPLYTRKDSLRGALRPGRTCFDVYFYDLTVRIIPRGKKITGKNLIYFKVTEPSSVIQLDLFPQYTIEGITWEGKPLTWTREFGAVFIRFPKELVPGEKQVISFSWSGKPGIAENPPWQGGFVWKKDKQHKRWAGVACEHLGASSWWPDKDHLSDKPDSMAINIEVPAEYKVVSNGILRNTRLVDKRYRRYEWFVDYPINNYNVTFYMGNFVHFTDTVMIEGKPLVMKYDVLPYNLDKAKEHFTQARDVVSFYSYAYGRYPFMADGFGLVESPYEGMEHQTAIAYGHGFRNSQFEGCDSTLKYDYIIVHEAAHEWWGNSVTASDMADIWIHEGFATYAELMYLEHKCGKEVYIRELNEKLKTILNFWPMVENYDVNENSFASNDVYNKGAIMLHCLRCNINNDTLFFDIIRDFNIQNRYGVVTSKDFISFVNMKTGVDYTPFFKKYLYETSLPVLQYRIVKEDDRIVLKFRWTGVEEGFRMPFCIRTDEGNAFRLEGTTTEQEAAFAGVKWFSFYNELQDLDGVPDNAYTYYRTNWER